MRKLQIFITKGKKRSQSNVEPELLLKGKGRSLLLYFIKERRGKKKRTLLRQEGIKEGIPTFQP